MTEVMETQGLKVVLLYHKRKMCRYVIRRNKLAKGVPAHIVGILGIIPAPQQFGIIFLAVLFGKKHLFDFGYKRQSPAA